MWVNAGSHQFHLPVADAPNRVDGIITLEVPDWDALHARLQDASRKELFAGTAFAWSKDGASALNVVCPYGNHFTIPKHHAMPTPHRLGIRAVQVRRWPGRVVDLLAV